MLILGYLCVDGGKLPCYLGSQCFATHEHYVQSNISFTIMCSPKCECGEQQGKYESRHP